MKYILARYVATPQRKSFDRGYVVAEAPDSTATISSLPPGGIDETASRREPGVRLGQALRVVEEMTKRRLLHR